MILELHREGLSVSAIARRAGMDRKTVRKYIAGGATAPAYGLRAARPTLIGAFTAFVTERVKEYPELSERRLLREIKALGYLGSRTGLGDILRKVRPPRRSRFEVRFETPAGQQAQVDFAHFSVVFEDEPQTKRTIWLFAMVLGHSRYIWGRFVEHQDLQTVIRCHIAAFDHMGDAPREIVYDRMKTAVLGENQQERHIVYNAKLLDLGKHYGFAPRACKAYRAKTKGKVERPFRYIRQDFFLARRFANLSDLNRQLRDWLDLQANARVHETTQRVVAEHFSQERATLTPPPVMRFNSVIKLERRVSCEGMVSVGGNYYSVPDRTRRRSVEVHTLANEIRIFEAAALLAVHPVLEGRRRSSIFPGHRTGDGKALSTLQRQQVLIEVAGQTVARRALNVYDAVAKRLAAEHRSRA